MTSAALGQPTHGLFAYLHSVRKRLSCGWRTGHVPSSEEWGYPCCLLCGVHLL